MKRLKTIHHCRKKQIHDRDALCSMAPVRPKGCLKGYIRTSVEWALQQSFQTSVAKEKEENEERHSEWVK